MQNHTLLELQQAADDTINFMYGELRIMQAAVNTFYQQITAAEANIKKIENRLSQLKHKETTSDGKRTGHQPQTQHDGPGE